MTPPAASATARSGSRAKPRPSLLAVLGAIVWVLWWVLWWPWRTLGRAIAACALGAFHRPARAAAIAALIVVALGSGYWFWLRNSSWVAIEYISVEGHTTQIEEINTALAAAASDMTTLNVDEESLLDALARFPTIRGLNVQTELPNRVTIVLDEKPPVASVAWNNRLLAVAGDGRILESISVASLDVPQIEVSEAPSAHGLEGEPLAQAQVLGAAPVPLRPLIERCAFEEGGVVLSLQQGIELRFGPADDLEAKWAAAAAVLADPKLDSVEYVDVRFPARPVSGGDPSLVPAEPSTSIPEAPTAAREPADLGL